LASGGTSGLGITPLSLADGNSGSGMNMDELIAAVNDLKKCSSPKC